MGAMDEAFRQTMAGRRLALIEKVRDHFAAFGIDTSSLTDDELEAGVAKMAELAATWGVSLADAFKVAQALATTDLRTKGLSTSPLPGTALH